MKRFLCAFLAVILCALTFVTAFAAYDFDYRTDDLREFAAIASTFGNSGVSVAGDDSVQADYDVRRTVVVRTDGRKPDLHGVAPDISVDGPDDIFALSFPTVEKAEECAELLSGRSGIIYAECDTTVSITEEEEYEEPIPDEEAEYHSWGIGYMHVEDLVKKVKETVTDPNREVIVAVVDSGITVSHPIFKNRLVEPKDFVFTDGECIDDNGHGTAVAGVVADCTQGLNVRIMPIKVLDSEGGGSAMIAAAGLEYAARNGADIINASFVSQKCSVRFHDAQAVAKENGSILVISAGNHGIDMDAEVCCPSHIPEVITVTAIDRYGELYHNNCYGTMVDVIAPGVLVDCASRSGNYQPRTGTSFAAPHIAAVLAMYTMMLPDASEKWICNLLVTNTLDVASSGFDVYSGWGLPYLTDVSAEEEPKTITKIGINTLPDKTVYEYKENIDYTGLSVNVFYSNGETMVLRNGFTTDCPELTYGEHTVTVTLAEHTTSFTVEVRYNWWQWIIVILLFGWIWY
ncbi:MAG: S8 family serine peptidase [Clostridia bacterium]|nr:S8 family serine peptidase [Clostridia bacterium]